MPNQRFIRNREVRAMFGGISNSTLYDKINEGFLPRPIKMGRVALWSLEELEVAARKLRNNREGEIA